MPFGLTNAPATFQSATNSLFASMMRTSVLVFMDDTLIYSPSLASHIEHLAHVFAILQVNLLSIKQSKYFFAQQQLEYLGQIISGSGVVTDPHKIQTVQNWPVPKNTKQLRGFLGLTGYYRKFIQHYSMLRRTLTNLLKKDNCFQWTFKEQQAFDLLKHKLLTTLVLALSLILPSHSQWKLTLAREELVQCGHKGFILLHT
jgi:hypothetical protein